VQQPGTINYPPKESLREGVKAVKVLEELD
jgi:hypothetical protein